MSPRCLLLAAVLLTACPPRQDGSGSSPDATGGADSAASAGGDGAVARSEARRIFAQRCVPCHGAEGNGDGPASRPLNPKPRDYRDPNWQDSVTDEYLMKIILEGGGAVGKSSAMPPNPDLGKRPEVVTALKDIVRAFRQDGG